MMRKIRDLDFDEIIAHVVRSIDPLRRRSANSNVNDEIASIKNSTDAITALRDHMTHAALRHSRALEDILESAPLIRALVRTQNHPLAQRLPRVKVQEGLRGPDAAPRLREIVAAHPELTWDVEAVQSLIIDEILRYGDHELDDSLPPWEMHWSAASAAFDALLVLITLRRLGDLEPLKNAEPVIVGVHP